MAATHSPYSKPFIALKVVLVPSFLGFIPPILAGCGLTEKSTFFTSTHNIIAGAIVFLLEIFFIFGAYRLNLWEIKRKLKDLNSQIRELECLQKDEDDIIVRKEIDRELTKLKKDRVALTTS